MFTGNTPAPGTAAHKRNEKIINQTPALKQARAISHGERYTEIQTQVTNEAYRTNFDKIDWNKK